MKRAAALIPFSHDHQHGLAQALRLRRAARSDSAEALASHAADTLAYARGELAEHMAREESELLPAVVHLGCATEDEAGRLAAEHLRLRVLGAQLAEDPSNAQIALELADTLRDHIRWEERELFQHWQERIALLDGNLVERVLAPEATKVGCSIAEPQDEPGANGVALGSMNATNVNIAPGKALAEAHIDRDVVFVVTAGSGQLLIAGGDDTGDDTTAERLVAGRTLALARGMRRRLLAGPDGLCFTSVHVRRGALAIKTNSRS